MSERCIYAMLLLREKRVVLSPMLERTAVCGTIAGEQCLRRRENSCKRMQRQIYLHYAECSRIWIKSALAPQRSALQRSANRGMSLATREQKAVMTDFAGDGRFGSFTR